MFTGAYSAILYDWQAKFSDELRNKFEKTEGESLKSRIKLAFSSTLQKHGNACLDPGTMSEEDFYQDSTVDRPPQLYRPGLGLSSSYLELCEVMAGGWDRVLEMSVTEEGGGDVNSVLESALTSMRAMWFLANRDLQTSGTNYRNKTQTGLRRIHERLFKVLSEPELERLFDHCPTNPSELAVEMKGWFGLEDPMIIYGENDFFY